MSKLIALFAVITAMTFCTLGNFWYVYGIWPRSWTMFVLFWFEGFFLGGVTSTILKEINESL